MRRRRGTTGSSLIGNRRRFLILSLGTRQRLLKLDLRMILSIMIKMLRLEVINPFIFL